MLVLLLSHIELYFSLCLDLMSHGFVEIPTLERRGSARRNLSAEPKRLHQPARRHDRPGTSDVRCSHFFIPRGSSGRNGEDTEVLSVFEIRHSRSGTVARRISALPDLLNS